LTTNAPPPVRIVETKPGWNEGALSDYEFDLFISYRRSGNVPAWVWNHLHPRLSACLADELSHEPSIFLDIEMDTGAHWPTRLERALLRTRILVAVWSAQYFRSRWCLAEWKTMADREKLVDPAHGLIYPVIFADSQSFPREALDRQARDMKRWNVPDPQYRETPDYVGFHREVQAMAQELAAHLKTVPPWNPQWPVTRPEPALASATPLPEL
jgi:hypothetical protein